MSGRRHLRAAADAVEMLPQIIRDERHRRGLSLREAAEQIPYAFADLSRFERGEKQPRAECIVRMLRWAAVSTKDGEHE